VLVKDFSVFSEEGDALHRAGWGIVLDRLLRGVGHGVNGRAAALASWIDLSDTGTVDTECLEPEVERLAALARMVSSLVVGSDEPSEVLLIGDVLEHLRPVHDLHRGLEGVAIVIEEHGTPPPIRAPWARLTHVLLILLGDMGWVADQLGARRVIVTSTTQGIRLGYSEKGDRTMAPLESRPLPPRDMILAALGPLVATWGLHLGEDGDSVVLRTLT
jgi:hypothetical protein